MTTMEKLLRHSVAVTSCAFCISLAFASGANAAILILADPADRIIRDTTGDGVGNDLGSISFHLGQVGEAGAADADDSRFFLPFDLTSEQIDAIEAVPAVMDAITLNISLGVKSNVTDVATDNGPVDLYVDIYGFNNRTDVNAAVSDYQNTDVTLLFDRGITPESPNTWLSFDITDFAKDEIAAGNEILAFRFQINPSFALPNSDGVFNRYLFHSADHATNKPYIEVIPEPSTYALIAGAVLFGIALILRRRAR